jgi:ubiquinone/menaquinone biosynthesis C-methylase UbiE
VPLPFSFPEIYEQALVGPLFRPFAEAMVDELAPAAGERVLDIACGTGIVARLARQRVGATGAVVGVDLSAPMLAVAREVAPDIDWREGDAVALPLAEGERFDVVACQQGLQFMADRAAAAAQMRRALVAGGRLAVSTWRSDHESPLALALREVAQRHLGPIDDRRYSLGDAAVLEALLRDAGLRDVRTKTVVRTVRFSDGAVFVRLNAIPLWGMSTRAKTGSEAEREQAIAAIVLDSADAVRPYTDAGGLAFDLATNVATARG